MIQPNKFHCKVCAIHLMANGSMRLLCFAMNFVSYYYFANAPRKYLIIGSIKCDCDRNLNVVCASALIRHTFCSTKSSFQLTTNQPMLFSYYNMYYFCSSFFFVSRSVISISLWITAAPPSLYTSYTHSHNIYISFSCLKFTDSSRYAIISAHICSCSMFMFVMHVLFITSRPIL